MVTCCPLKEKKRHCEVEVLNERSLQLLSQCVRYTSANDSFRKLNVGLYTDSDHASDTQ